MRISTYRKLDIHASVQLLAFSLAVASTLSPFWGGQKFGGIDIPDTGDHGPLWGISGFIAFILLVLGYIPIWASGSEHETVVPVEGANRLRSPLDPPVAADVDAVSSPSVPGAVELPLENPPKGGMAGGPDLWRRRLFTFLESGDLDVSVVSPYLEQRKVERDALRRSPRMTAEEMKRLRRIEDGLARDEAAILIFESLLRVMREQGFNFGLFEENFNAAAFELLIACDLDSNPVERTVSAELVFKPEQSDFECEGYCLEKRIRLNQNEISLIRRRLEHRSVKDRDLANGVVQLRDLPAQIMNYRRFLPYAFAEAASQFRPQEPFSTYKEFKDRAQKVGTCPQSKAAIWHIDDWVLVTQESRHFGKNKSDLRFNVHAFDA
jgi:hypothetical protein